MNKISNKNKQVCNFLDELNHPLREEIEVLRNYILSANSKLTENIKWNGPNYCFETEDRINMRVQPLQSKQVQLVFHRGAKKQEQPKEKLIDVNSKHLIWKENDRAVATFKNMTEIENSEKELIVIIEKWIDATK